jgi:hypothetical protein
MRVRLPSGRSLVYRNIRSELRAPRWAPSGDPVPTTLFDSTHGFPKTIYGGLTTENVTQATCRDLLCDALIRTPNVVLHVHDEIVAEVPEGVAADRLADLLSTMSTAPEWALNFPITVEGYSCTRYSKTPFLDSLVADAHSLFI